MAQLVVRNLDDDLVRALRDRAARHGRSAEAEHREILREALRQEPEEDPKAVLAEMPTVGEDADFARLSDQPRSVEL
jgi:plasmid stability protein